MAIAKWVDESGSCPQCGHLYPGRCSVHDPNLSVREKHIIDEFIERAKAAGLDGRTLSRLGVSMKQPYKEGR